jgi:hypothetical protein
MKPPAAYHIMACQLTVFGVAGDMNTVIAQAAHAKNAVLSSNDFRVNRGIP